MFDNPTIRWIGLLINNPELDLKIKDAEIVLSELEEKVKKVRQEVEIFKQRKQNLELYDFIKRKSNNCRYCKKTFGFITEVEKHESVCIQNAEAMMGQNHVLPIEAEFEEVDC
ncbi:hypothetical protein R6Q59_024553 [Mikania micrantha]